MPRPQLEGVGAPTVGGRGQRGREVGNRACLRRAPPTRLNPTRPSPVIDEHRPVARRVAGCQCRASRGDPARTCRRVPPRWTVAVSRALSQTRPSSDARLCGPLPTAIVRDDGDWSQGRCGRSGRRSCRRPRPHRRSRAPTTGQPDRDPAVTMLLPGSMRETRFRRGCSRPRPTRRRSRPPRGRCRR